MSTATAEILDNPTATVLEPPAQNRQFVTFMVGEQSYGIAIAAVREIICWTQVTPLPNQPPYTRGVLNLRGTIIPVHDLRMRLSGARTDATETHVIVITCLGTQTLGILVDAVSDILSVSPDEMKAPPHGAESVASAALVSTEGDRLLNILNMTALFGNGAAGRV